MKQIFIRSRKISIMPIHQFVNMNPSRENEFLETQFSQNVCSSKANTREIPILHNLIPFKLSLSFSKSMITEKK